MQNQGNAPLWVRQPDFVWKFRQPVQVIDRRIVGQTCPGHHMLVESRASRLLN